MSKFKRTIFIEAVQCREAIEAFKNGGDGLPDWLKTAYETKQVLVKGQGVDCRLTCGYDPAKPDDWLILHESGTHREVWPCKADIFAATYEPVEGE